MLRIIVPPNGTIGLAILTQTSEQHEVLRMLDRRGFSPATNVTRKDINGSTKALVVALGAEVKHPKLGHPCYLGIDRKGQKHHIPKGQSIITDTVIAIAPVGSESNQ